MKDEEVWIGAGLLLLLLFGMGAGGEPVDPGPGGPGPGPDPDPDDPKPLPKGVIVPLDPGPKPPKVVGGIKWGDPVQPPQPPPQTPSLGELIATYPGPGRLYQVVSGDTLGGTHSGSVARRYLLSAGFLAAKEYGGLGDAAANQFARQVGDNTSHRVWAMNVIQCSGWNDWVNGTWGYDKDKTTPGPHGRGLRFLPQHPDNIKRLQDGKAPGRNMALRTPADAGKGNAYGVHPELREKHELLWLPAINLKALWESSGTVVTTEGETWPDGSSKMWPPPWILARGVDDYSGSAIPSSVGCGDGEGEVGG